MGIINQRRARKKVKGKEPLKSLIIGSTLMSEYNKLFKVGYNLVTIIQNRVKCTGFLTIIGIHSIVVFFAFINKTVALHFLSSKASALSIRVR